MIISSLDHVQGRSIQSPQVQLRVKQNLAKKAFASNQQPYQYSGKDGYYDVTYPNDQMRQHLFNTTKRGNTDQVLSNPQSAATLVQLVNPLSIYSIQSLHDLCAPGNVNRGGSVEENRQLNIMWNNQRQTIEEQLVKVYGPLSDQAFQQAQRSRYQMGVEGQSVFQNLNHIQVDNLSSQLQQPISVFAGSKSSVLSSGINQPGIR